MKRINVNFSLTIRNKYCMDFLNAILDGAIEELKSCKDINITINRNDMQEVKKMTMFDLKKDSYNFLKEFSKVENSGMSVNSLVNYLIKYKLRDY